MNATKFEPWIRYVADRARFGTAVLVLEGPEDRAGLSNFRYLQKRRDLADLSEEFGWGHSGPSAAQLALAILADHFQDRDGRRALLLYPLLESLVIANLNKDRWILTSEQIARVIQGHSADFSKEAA